MNVIRVNTKEIRLSEEEMATLRKALKILDAFTDAAGSTYGEDAKECLESFLNEDVPGGVYRVDLEDGEF